MHGEAVVLGETDVCASSSSYPKMVRRGGGISPPVSSIAKDSNARGERHSSTAMETKQKLIKVLLMSYNNADNSNYSDDSIMCFASDNDSMS